jgi:transcriptional regulator with XRE-family HTH domain
MVLSSKRRERPHMARGMIETTDSQAGPSAPTDRLGPEIRDLRKARALTLQRVAEQTGLSIGHLSEIERGQAVPSVKALHDIAETLGVTIGWFFHNDPDAPESEREFIVRAASRRKLRYKTGVTDELLCPNLSGALEMLLCRFPPGSSSGDVPYTHRGEEAGIVTSGSLEMWIGDKHFVLQQGDSFRFNSTTPHRYQNSGDDEAVVIWTITPPSY